VYRPPFPTEAFWEQSSTARGQLAGLAMIMVPALTNPLPFGPAMHLTLQTFAVLVGFAGAVIVFGGLVNRVFIQPSGQPLDEVLPTLPYARTVWWTMLLLTILLVAGVEWRFVLIFTDGWARHLPEVVMLALPALAIGWATWRGRVMRRPPEAPPPGEAAEPVQPVDPANA
jgi:hypothetical protein